MSTPVAGRAALERYFTKFYEMTSRLKGVEGVVRANAVHTANYPYLHGFDAVRKDRGPYRYITYHPDDRGVDIILQRVLAVLQAFPTVRHLGFTMDKLLEMDYATFSDVEDVVRKMIADKNKQATNAHDEMEDLLDS